MKEIDYLVKMNLNGRLLPWLLEHKNYPLCWDTNQTIIRALYWEIKMNGTDDFDDYANDAFQLLKLAVNGENHG